MKMQPWDQQQDEGPVAYKAFRRYLDMGSGRTVVGAYRASRGPQPGGKGAVKTSGRWNGWSTKHRWHDRAAAYDAKDNAIVEKARADVILTVASDRAARMLAQERTEQQIAVIVGGKILRILEGEIDVDDFATVARLSEVFMRLGRTSLNMPVKVELDDSPDAPYFDTSGEMDAALADGQAPAMPADAHQRPAITSGIGARGEGLRQPNNPPRP
jgi:hypothetical protein